MSSWFSGPAITQKEIAAIEQLLAGKSPLHVVVVGNHSTGKSTLATGATKSENGPYDFSVKHNETPIPGVLHLTRDLIPFNRPWVYPLAHIIVITYAVDDWASFADVRDKWRREIDYYCPSVPVILCACKTDLRKDPTVTAALKKKGLVPVTPETGALVANEIRATHYLESHTETAAQTREEICKIVLELLDSKLPKVEEVNPVVEGEQEGWFGSLWSAGATYFK